MSKETAPMTDKTQIEAVIDEDAQDSLKPQSHTENDPKSKVETLKSIVGHASSMTNTDLTKWFTQMIDLYPAVAKAHGDASANKATNNMKAGGTPLAAMAPVKIKEDMDSLFEGETLSEEAKEKITTLFEAAVSIRATIVEAELEEAYAVALEEEVSEFIAETTKQIESFLDYSVDKWISENEVAIVDSLRLENAEQFMESVKGALVESYIDVPEDRLDVVSEMAETVTDLEAELSKSLAENLALKAQIAEATQETILDDIKEGLTMVDAEKLDTLIESVDFVDAESYAKKVSLIREKHFPSGAKPKNDGVETLNENNLAAEDVVVYTDPLVEAAVRAMDKMR